MAVSDADKDTAKLPTVTRCMDGTGLFLLLKLASLFFSFVSHSFVMSRYVMSIFKVAVVLKSRFKIVQGIESVC